MKLKTKMLKNLISVLCAATIATSGVVTSVSAGNTFSSCCKKKGQSLTTKDEFKLKYDEAKSIYDEILAGKSFLDKREENRLNSIEMKFVKLSEMYDEIINSGNDEKILAAIDKVDKLQKDMAKLLSKVQNALAEEESLPLKRRKALNDRLYNFINKVYELEQWIINNQISDKDKDSAIVVEIAWIGVRCQELESEYNALLNEKEINHDRYKKLIDEGDRFIKRIDHFKEKHGLAKLMAAAEMVNGIENPLRRRFYEVTSKTKDKASRRIAEITAEIQKLREENTKIFESEKRDLEEREAANLMFVAGKNKKEAINGFNDVITNHAKKQAMNQLKKNDVGLKKQKAMESLNKVDNILINKIKDNKKYAMDQLKKNNVGLMKTNKLAQITENVMNRSNKKYAMDKLIKNDVGLQKKQATEALNATTGRVVKENKRYVMDKLIKNDVGLQKKQATEALNATTGRVVKENKRYAMGKLIKNDVSKYWEAENMRLKKHDDEIEAQRKKDEKMRDLKAKKDKFNKVKTEVRRQFNDILQGEDYMLLGLEIKDQFSLKVVEQKKESIEKKFEKLKGSTDMDKVYQLKDEVDKFQKYIEGLKKIEQVAENKEGSEKKKADKITKNNGDVLIKKVNKKTEEFKERYSQALKRVSVIPKSERETPFKVVRVGAYFDTQGVEKRARVIFDEFDLNLKRLKENLNLDSVEKFSQETDKYIMELDAYIEALDTYIVALNTVFNAAVGENNTVFNAAVGENKDCNEHKKTDRVSKKKRVTFNLNPIYSN